DITRTSRCLIRAKQSQEEFYWRFDTLRKRRKRRLWLENENRLMSVNNSKYIRSLTSKVSSWITRTDEADKHVERLKRSPERLIIPNSLKSEVNVFKIKTKSTVPDLLEVSISPVYRLSNLFVSLFTNISTSEMPTRWSTTYKKMKRIYDIVMDENDNVGDEDIYEPNVPPFLKNIVGIVKSFNGARNERILSPRIAPLFPDKAGSHGFLSPTLFPFYKDETERQILSVPKILEDSGLNAKDRERVLETIMELSGARGIVDNAMKILDNLSSLGAGKELLRVGHQIHDSFERLRSSLSADQSSELNKRGFTFMKVQQMKNLHKEQGLKEPQIEEQVENYGRLTKAEREEALWKSIAEIAGIQLSRKRRDTSKVSVLSPVVLSPYQFAPVYGFSILGPVVLSPNIFSPLILDPSVLGPWVLSPSIPLPFILSPYLLSPYVLSPLVMAPFILSPYVLSPNVINPYILSPVILSPVVLCPDVLSPMVLGGPILSPGVLSPSVLSKSFMMASVLSPTVLS
ncbi:hypothetical protein DICVIV_12158, partial [Dictyocaulus viviparus]